MKFNRFPKSGFAVALALAVTPALAASPLPSIVEAVEDAWGYPNRYSQLVRASATARR